MAIFPLDHVDNYGTLEEFARNDGSYRIYKVALSQDAQYTHYYLIRKPEDEETLRNDSSLFYPILVYDQGEDSTNSAARKLDTQQPVKSKIYHRILIAIGAICALFIIVCVVGGVISNIRLQNLANNPTSYSGQNEGSGNLQQQLSLIDIRNYFPTANHTRLIYHWYTDLNANTYNAETQDISRIDETHYKESKKSTNGKNALESTYTVTKKSITNTDELGSNLILTNESVSWSPSAYSKVEITGLNKQIQTPAGNFSNCIEVTTEMRNKNNGKPELIFMKDYYAPKVGQVKRLVRVPDDTNLNNYTMYGELISIQ